MQQKCGIIYLWYDRKRKMFYLGAHWGSIDDGYICSSNRMRKAFRRRPQDFKRRVLETNILSKSEMFLREEKWLSLIKDDELGNRYYNLQKHWKHWNCSNEKQLSVKQKISKSVKKLHKNPIYREKFLEGRKKLPPRSKEAIEKTAKANRGKKRSEETKRKISEALKGENNPLYGKTLSDEHKKKIAEALTGEKNPFYGKQHDPELKKRMNEKTSKTMKGKSPNNAEWMKSAKWWNNGTINKRSSECPGDEWIKGRV